ncbi:MAG: carboxypeptidase regulatory-like domain-containing protein, partial [Candidatus Aminicenantaceae bacterium]
MKRSFIISISFLTFSLMLFSLWLAGQRAPGRARLMGRVADESGNPIANAKVTLRSLRKIGEINEGFERTATTNKKGLWIMTNLGSGLCMIEASAPGFHSHVERVFISQINPNFRLNFKLKKIESPPEEQEEPTDEMFFKYFEEANRLFEEGKYKEAVVTYKLCLDENPEAYQIHYYMGNCYRRMDEIVLAQEEYEKVAQGLKQEKRADLAKIHCEVLSFLGELSLERKDKEAALNYYKEALEFDPRNENLVYTLGDICFSLRKIEDAI